MYDVPVGYVLFILCPLMFIFGYSVRWQIEDTVRWERKRKRRHKRNNL